jgi:cytochrome oxidase Cu insertion factor (SCO1/SenC/PrrC family)
MCDEGWKRPGGDWLSCVPEDSDASDEETDPHDESLGEYNVGHTTTTFIIDRNGDKRIAWGGIMWDPGLFLDDIGKLANE